MALKKSIVALSMTHTINYQIINTLPHSTSRGIVCLSKIKSPKCESTKITIHDLLLSHLNDGYVTHRQLPHGRYFHNLSHKVAKHVYQRLPTKRLITTKPNRNETKTYTSFKWKNRSIPSSEIIIKTRLPQSQIMVKHMKSWGYGLTISMSISNFMPGTEVLLVDLLIWVKDWILLIWNQFRKLILTHLSNIVLDSSRLVLDLK